MPYYVYIIESVSTCKWYYGYTEQPEERLKYHNSNHYHYTGGKGPWKLIFLREFVNRPDALAFERKLKKTRNKDYIKREYCEYFLQG